MKTDRRARALLEHRAREWISRKLGFQLLDRRPDDRFIVAFPRSGSTWIRAVVTNVVVPWSRSSPDVFNALIPGVTIRGAISARSLARPRLLASHCDLRTDLPRVLYCVRDGRDVVVSLYHYLVTRRGLAREVSFARFFDEHLGGEHGTPWHVSVGRWLRGAADMGPRIMVVRYEDLVADPVDQMTPALEFLGIDADRAALERALEEASIANMRRIEARRLGGAPPAEHSFYRRGETGRWREWLTPQMEQRFLDVAGETLRLAGYAGQPRLRLNDGPNRGNERSA